MRKRKTISPAKATLTASGARAAAPRTPAAPRKRAIQIPPILLEGDKPAMAPVSGPGQRYSLGPTPPAVERLEEEGSLPESYGTRQLLLAARDPHWLYAHWDLTRDQQRNYNALAREGHLALRIYAGAAGGEPESEVHVHPESRHWFVHVRRAGTKYAAELGYPAANGDWVTIATSGVTLTPPDTAAIDTTVEFATIPFDLPMAKLLTLVKEAVHKHLPLAQALRELRAQGHPELPRSAPSPAQWTPAQEQALASVLSMDDVRRVWMGSLEITELIRRQALKEMASMVAARLGAISSAGVPTSVSSPFGGVQAAKGFWFNINAELIVYGATEPDATVTIGERTIKLRPDGSFSYRFALPDGQYDLSVVAVSADRTDGRAAELAFSRATEYRGDVGTHPQDPALRTVAQHQF